MDVDKHAKDLIQKRIKQIKESNAKKYLMIDMLFPEKQKKKDEAAINQALFKIEGVYSQFKAEIKNLKLQIPDITEQTVKCAVYLVYGKVCHTWEAVFILAKNGFNFEVMELARSINENLDLIQVFHLDKTGKHLADWFDGKIIDNKTARQIEHDFIIKGDLPSIKEHDLSPYDMSTDVYRVLSKYTHCSYVALLDSVDVYSHNFDWNKYGGFYYVNHNFHEIESTMISTLITLKLTLQETGDHANFDKVNKLLVETFGEHNEETLKKLIPKIKKLDNQISRQDE